MENRPIANNELREVAQEVLDKLQTASRAAADKLRNWAPIGPDALAAVNTMASPNDIRVMEGINRKNRESLERLVTEPSVARVSVVDEQGGEVTYYFCRGEQGMPERHVISYLAPLGRLASLPIGEDFTAPDGRLITVRERAELHPVSDMDGWDSIRTIAEGPAYGAVTVQSLRDLLVWRTPHGEIDDVLSQILEEESERQNIFEGVRRSVITKMGLRDQPVLDKYQDEIFRLPINTRLLILGPPGTGKTTTLIRRLAQKCDHAFLDEDEQRLVENAKQYSELPHSDSWLMFTPTVLLKQYLKEAFNRERVPASDHRVWTWSDYRRYLARDLFGLLRTSTGRGGFILKISTESISGEALNNSIAWFSDFDRWQKDDFFKELRGAAEKMERGSDPNIQKLSERIIATLADSDEGNLWPLFQSFAPFAREAETVLADLKAGTDAVVRGALNLQVNRNPNLLSELAEFLDSLRLTAGMDQDGNDDLDADTDLEAEDDGEDDLVSGRTGRAAAINMYTRTVRAQARAIANKRALRDTSLYGQVSLWLEDRTLNPSDLQTLGENLVVQAGARVIASPVKRYFRRMGRRYRAFRRRPDRKERWYIGEPSAPSELGILELDVVLLALLRTAADLVSRPGALRDLGGNYWQPLKEISEKYKNQILVDEATDFSPIQLACMAALVHPIMNSFCACGDFNQRLTTWGTRTPEEMGWALKSLDTRSVSIPYRQSRQLAEFAANLIQQDLAEAVPKNVSNEGVQVALIESASFDQRLDWIAARIKEIEGIVDALPSIAVFVNSENDVARVAAVLNERLTQHNIPVMACHEGQAVGQESNVRVFDIQHIKGLEFEAAFFVSIDALANAQADLFDKYVYVGATRAATYLGFTCESNLPGPLVRLRHHFVPSWELVDT